MADTLPEARLRSTAPLRDTIRPARGGPAFAGALPPLIRLFAALVALLLMAGCPKKIDLTRVDQVRGSDAAAERDWKLAKAAFEADPGVAAKNFEAFLLAHPKVPLVPVAQLYLARSRLASQDYAAAKEVAEKLLATKTSQEVARAARYVKALADLGLGDARAALPVLSEYREAFSDPAENARAALALGEAAAQAGELRRAVAAFSEAYDRSELAADKLYAKTRAQALSQSLNAEEAKALYEAAPKDSLAAAVLAPRIARDLVAAGEERRATDVLSESRAARVEIFGTDAVEGLSLKASDPKVIGAVIPLSGKTFRIGRLFLRGLLFAAGGAARPGDPPAAFKLVIRDSQSSPEGAKAAVEELVKIEGVTGIVGPSDPDEARAAAKTAQELGTPMISLSLDPEVTSQGDAIFWASVDNNGQARSLARFAVERQKQRRVAILAPDTSYGRSLAAAFADEARAKGAEIVADERYAEGAVTWDKQIKALVKAKPDAIFIPDGPKALTGLAPALAAGGLWSRPPGKKPPKGRAVQILGTSPAIATKLLSDAGSSLDGAVFATEFFADDPRVKAFADEFSRREGEDPTFFDAAAYEAFTYLAQAIGGGAQGRAALKDALIASPFSSLSGEVRFGGDRRAVRDLTLVRVVGPNFEVVK
jgi:branched-chain amino acid transport system substrate-binding protein